MTKSSTTRPHNGFTIGFDLGTVGTWVRIIIGVIAALAFLVIDLSDRSGAFLLEAVVWFLAILAMYTAVFGVLAPRILPRLNPWLSSLVFYGPVLVLPYVEGLPDAFRVALSLYVSVSILVVVFVGYGGCEVVGIPSLLLRRRYVVYCPWNTVDLVDKAIADSKWSGQLQSTALEVAAVALAISILTVGAIFLGEAFPLAWLAAAIGSLLIVGVTVLVTKPSQSR